MTESERMMEFNQIKEKWMEHALTAWAKQQIEETVPFLSETELRKQMRDTTEARRMLDKCGTPPLVTMEGAEEILRAAEIGDCLMPEQLERAADMLTAVSRLKDYLNRCKQYQISAAYYEENLQSMNEIREEIRQQIRGGRIEDRASKELFSIRTDIIRTEDKMKEKAESVLRSNKEAMSDNFCTLRNGRICVPVKKEYKFRISGSVIDKSSTGNTLFIEPTGVSHLFEELQILKIEEENEERRILYTLTAKIADHTEEMRQNLRTIERLDFIFSKGKLSQELDGVEPDLNMERRIVLKDGRHPLMEKTKCIPLQFRIGDGVQGIVITGPNTGGKTVTIKTVALCCMMAQCGLHVTCREADICMNSNYLCDIGDGQNLSENLSTFSAHITNVLHILQNVGRDSFVIMDELGSGTDPTEGMGIAIAILEELRQSGCLFLVTTHYPEVKQYAQEREGIVNAKMTFDRNTLQPLYQMVIGEAGESCAFYIAARLGMPQNMLKTAAQAAYGEEARDSHNIQNVSGKFDFLNSVQTTESKKKTCTVPKIRKTKSVTEKKSLTDKFQLGDSVLIYPERKIGIVCEKVNDKGVLRVQLPNKKIWINHKRVKLHVAAAELYPEDYDFSIVFDTVANRKLRHRMERKYVEGEAIVYEE